MADAHCGIFIRAGELSNSAGGQHDPVNAIEGQGLDALAVRPVGKILCRCYFVQPFRRNGRIDGRYPTVLVPVRQNASLCHGTETKRVFLWQRLVMRIEREVSIVGSVAANPEKSLGPG